MMEVKPDVNGSADNGNNYIEYACEKIKSVRVLKRTSTSTINSGVKFPPRPLTKIIGGFLSTTNTYTHKNNNTIEKYIRENEGFKGIDIGCIADYGSFHVDYTGEEDTKLTRPEDFDKRYSDYYQNRKFNKIKFSDKENSLVSFFFAINKIFATSNWYDTGY